MLKENKPWLGHQKPLPSSLPNLPVTWFSSRKETLHFILPPVLSCRTGKGSEGAPPDPRARVASSICPSQTHTLLLPDPAMRSARPRHSDSAGTAHRTVPAHHRSSGSDTPSWYQWSSAGTDGRCCPVEKHRKRMWDSWWHPFRRRHTVTEDRSTAHAQKLAGLFLRQTMVTSTLSTSVLGQMRLSREHGRNGNVSNRRETRKKPEEERANRRKGRRRK